jgi:competence protein ComEC
MALSPEITTISCGENNRYGHPGEEALCNIKESGSAVYETMECGRIRIRMENGKPVVEKFLEGR